MKIADFEKMLPVLNGFQIVTPGVTTLETLRAMGAYRPPTPLWQEVNEKDIQIPMRDGTSIRVRSYSPSQHTTAGKPLAVFAFGGGYVMGSLESEEANCRSWVKTFGGVAISIGYRYVVC